MAKIAKSIPLIVVLLLGIGLQLIFICADDHDAPNMAAAEFAKAYFMLDECTMDKYACASMKSDEAVKDYLYQVSENAAARGFDASYMKNRLTHMQTTVIESDDTHAVVDVTAVKTKSLNPVYELVGRLFCLVDSKNVSKQLDLVREGDEWKVCGDI